MTLQEHALRAMVKGWMLSIRALNRQTFEELSLGFLFGPSFQMSEEAVPGLGQEVAALTRELLQEIGEQELLAVDSPRQ